MSISIRQARPGDGAAIFAMVKALAVSHGEEANLTATPESYEAVFADPHAVVGMLIAEADGVPAGCAIWHRSYSTFRGRETLYLEDLSVLPEFRRRGIARLLLKAVAELAVAKGYPSVYWFMMAWNEGARKLYQDAGAEIEDGTCVCRLHGEALERLAQ